jgi:hypothetical protein
VATFAPDEIRGSAFAFLVARQSFGNLSTRAVVGVRHSLASRFVRLGFDRAARVVQC